jgi:hypothetical protein
LPVSDTSSDHDAPQTEVAEQASAEVAHSLRSVSETRTYWLARFAILRLLGLIYFIAFLVFINQGIPLLGENGLLPAQAFLERVAHHFGTPGQAFFKLPTLFWLKSSDGFLLGIAWSGAFLSLLVLLGFANAPMLVILWFLYLSIHHIGQLWYGFGWESQLCETGFLAIFLCPLWDPRPFPKRPPPIAVLWLFRWLIFRIMLGAGLIKLRGDPCWRDLTCLYYHYETQPIPNPISALLHFLPRWFHQLGVLYNYLAELVAPFFLIAPRQIRHIAGLVLAGLQFFLILSGNLSFLNWLTLVPIVACFDDRFLSRFVPRGWWRKFLREPRETVPARSQRIAAAVLAVLIALLSIEPVTNLLSSRQLMNTSFEPFELVNSYGAFGSVGKVRYEIIFEGTEADAPTEDAEWRPYEFKCKPGNPDRRPCFLSPYHLRLDWLIWFAAMSSPEQAPWTVHLLWKLLHNDRGALSLLANDPFPKSPPRFLRAQLYRYHFAPLRERGWWTRTLVGPWLPALSSEDPRLREFLESYGWLSPEADR